MKRKDLAYKLSMAFWFALAGVTILFLSYRFYIQNTSEEIYSVCTMYAKYITAKDVGKKYEYYVNGIRYEDVCTSQACIDAEIGSKFLIKYWKKKPKWTKIYFDKPVNKSIQVPIEGWNEIPEFLRDDL